MAYLMFPLCHFNGRKPPPGTQSWQRYLFVDLETKMLPLKDRANWSPAQARGQFRHNFFPLLPTGGISAGFTQVSVHIVPSSAAGHLAEFCRMNHGPCPIVHQSKPGEVSASPIAADSDIR